ncbi:5-hydroxytryptamine receptor 1-like [Sarcoptes scabiei]|nr:5-hydroxytryptamine receptor 1-like [Sarcoptes scabiei]
MFESINKDDVVGVDVGKKFQNKFCLAQHFVQFSNLSGSQQDRGAQILSVFSLTSYSKIKEFFEPDSNPTLSDC